MKKEQSNAAILAELGARLKQERAARNINQSTLAYESGVPTRTLSRLENGHSVSFEAVIKVLRALDLLDRLDLLVPEPEISPIAISKTGVKGRRQRASKKRSQASSQAWTGFNQSVIFDERE